MTGRIVEEDAERVVLERPSGGVMSFAKKDLKRIVRDGQTPVDLEPASPAGPAPSAPGGATGKVLPLGPVEGKGYAVVLVPIGSADPALLLEVARGIAPDLGIPVLVQDAGLAMPPASRDRYKTVLDELRKKLRENLTKDAVEEAMKHHHVKPEDLENDIPVIKVHAEMILRHEGRSVSERFTREIGALSGDGGQWDVDDLVVPLEKAVAPYARPEVVHVLVTSGDLCDEGLDFVYTGARKEKRIAAVSYCRFRPEWEGKTPDRRLLYQRLRKQCLVGISLLFGTGRCDDAQCALSHPQSRAEYDAKSGALCAICQGRFHKLFGIK